MRDKGYFLFHNRPDCRDLVLRYLRAHSSWTYQAYDSVRSKHPNSLIERIGDLNEYVACKERKLQPTTPVTPVVENGDNGEKDTNTLLS
ncbi:MAG: hypothetical protein WB787_10130 [Candidatus Acidiferrales bacterium]